MTIPMLPTLFISHGSPDLPLQSSPARDFLKQLGQDLHRPKAILVISAHWNTRHPVVSTALQPKTIYDFSGFPAELYRLTYPAPGAPDLAQRVVELLTATGITTEVSRDRGLDHGAWNPLMMIYPDADIPVTQLSIQPHLDPTSHFAIGQALVPLRQEGVLILASGSATHNLRELGEVPTPVWVTAFTEWLSRSIAMGETKELLNYRQLAPYAVRNHPTDEHLLPLFVAMGAGGGSAKGTQLHDSFTHGTLSMAAYQFDAAIPS
jgi:4,5-DOPA dioxygenase extradiol